MSKELWENLAQAKKKKKTEIEHKSLTLEDEIGFIVDPEIKYFTEWVLSTVSPAFFKIPASKGNHHPWFSRKECGLIIHIKYAVRIARELFKNPLITNFTQTEQDIIISALLLHDIGKAPLKNSQGVWNSYLGHASIARHHIIQSIDDSKDPRLLEFKQTDCFYLITTAVKYHMGLFFEYKEKPEFNKISTFVHMCDYLSSLKVVDYIESL